MHKLVILVGPLEDRQAFDEGWPDFLHQAEQMPGLIRETTSQVEHVLFGSSQFIMMHELYFGSSQAIQAAMASPHGKAAGALLQRITQGQLVLFISDHKEDSLDNIRQYTTWDDKTN